EREVLHVSSADLNDIAISFDQTDVRFFERFGDDVQPKRLADLGDDFPSFLAQTLKCIRGRAGFPDAAAEKVCAALLHCLCDSECLIPALDRARSRDYGEFISSDGGVP